MTERPDFVALFDLARRADIERVAGLKLRRQGRRLRGECPLCRDKPKPALAPAAEGSRKRAKRKGPSTAFSVDPVARLYKCFSCGEGGDVVDLERKIRGGSLVEAAGRLAGGGPARVSAEPIPRRSEPRRVEGAARLSGPERLAREILNGCRPEPLSATPGARYLLGRGIPEKIVRAIGGRLRFNPQAKWGWDEERQGWIYAPAIVAKVRCPEGPTGGLHVTYLAADGSRKAALEPAKRMWGPQRDAQGRPGAVWLLTEPAGAPVIVSEGIESGLSAAALQAEPCRVVAALSLEALQGGWLADKWGRIDPAAVASDPERPAFTWPGLAEVNIAVDRDMKPIRRKARKLGGGTYEAVLDAEDRARICAGLAAQAWRRAGASVVRVIAPAAGRDFNDELREGAGA